MGKVIRFFNYDASLSYYEDKIKHMRQASTGRHDGVRIIAKPILILSLIKGIKEGIFIGNHFDYQMVNKLYEGLFRQYFVQGRQRNLTPLCYPFYFLTTDEFWHLSWKVTGKIKTESPSKAWLERNVDFGYIDEELWILLANDEYRDRLKQYVVENNIIQPLHDIDIAAESHIKDGLKAFVTLLLAI